MRGISRLTLEMTSCSFGFYKVYSTHSPLGSARSPNGRVFLTYRYAKIAFAPSLVSASLEMTRLNTVPLGWWADEGVRPYHALSNVSTGIAYLPAGVPCHRLLANGGSPSGGRGTPLPKRNTLSKSDIAQPYECHPIPSLPQPFSTFKALRGLGHSRKAARRRADEGVRPYRALPKVSTGIADLPAGAPCHRRLAHGGSPFCYYFKSKP